MRRWLGLGLRLAGTVAALVWISTRVDLDGGGRALGRIPIATFALAALLVAGNVVVGAVRWRLLLRAYGAVRLPGLARLVRFYFIAFFYNNYLPGAVGGDVGRGIVTRDAFDREGATGALAVVLVERALGMLALFILLGCGVAMAGGTLDTTALAWWTVIGCAGSCALVAMLPFGRSIAPYLPGPLGRAAAKLPALQEVRPFIDALVLALVAQLLVVLAGWALLAALADLPIAAPLLVVPLASATMFLPITVGGAGAREAVYVALCGHLFGMPEADALAASLGLWFAHLAAGAVGGVLQLRGAAPAGAEPKRAPAP